MRRLLRLVGSARFARGVIVFLILWTGLGAWGPWRTGDAPAWGRLLGLDRPFSAWPFLASVTLLFGSTLVCTYGWRARVAARRRGELPAGAAILRGRSAEVTGDFLRREGFRGEGPVLFRNRWALAGGWIFHVGLLVLMGGVLVQRSLHDSGQFELAEGEVARLSDPGVVFGRDAGLLAGARPPDLRVALVRFDPHLHQAGYARDRRSTLALGEDLARTALLDRAAGIDAAGLTIHQALPTGLTLTLESPGGTPRSLHLGTLDAQTAARRLTGPDGAKLKVLVSSERPLEAPEGTGALTVQLEEDGGRRTIVPGDTFLLAEGPVTLVGYGRWSGYTYERSPGLSAVFGGFGLLLFGSLLLAFPSGVARIDGAAARVHLSRGLEVLEAEWSTLDSPPTASAPDVMAE